MLSNTSRALTYVCAILYAILGALLFFAPERFATIFAWNVTPFITMTIGAWCLGNAWLAWISARRWVWALVYTGLIYLWLFGTLETLILIAFRNNVRLAHPIAWLYVVTLIVNLTTAIVGFLDLRRIRPSYVLNGPPMPASYRTAAIAYVIFVGFLSIYGLIAQIGWPATQGGVFPEKISLFTLRSFAAFYFSLTVGAIPLIRERNLSVFLNHALVSYTLVVFISIAAFANIGLFNFIQRPGGLLYIGAYLVVAILILFVFAKHGTGIKE